MSESNTPTNVGSTAGLGRVAPKCACGDRSAAECPGEWEPGCDLGANEAFASLAPDVGAEVDKALGINRALGGVAKPGRALGSDGD
jgi:hypothetical protein